MFKAFICGLTIGGIGAMTSMHFHFVRTHERLMIVSRVHQPSLRSSYVDVREWAPGMWLQFPDLMEAMEKAGRQDLLARDGRPAMQQIVPSIQSVTQPAGQHRASPAVNPPVQQAAPYSVFPTSIPRDPPTAQSTAPIPVVRDEPLMALVNGVIKSPEEHNRAISRQNSPLADVSIPSVKVPPPIEQKPAVQTPAEAGNRSWFGTLLESVIPKVQESVKENVSSAHSAAASFSKQLEELQAQARKTQLAAKLKAAKQEVQKPVTVQVAEAAARPKSEPSSTQKPSTKAVVQAPEKEVVASKVPAAEPVVRADDKSVATAPVAKPVPEATATVAKAAATPTPVTPAPENTVKETPVAVASVPEAAVPTVALPVAAVPVAPAAVVEPVVQKMEVAKSVPQQPVVAAVPPEPVKEAEIPKIARKEAAEPPVTSIPRTVVQKEIPRPTVISDVSATFPASPRRLK